MKSRRSLKHAVAAEKAIPIRPANDSRPGPEKAARTAKERASRARDEIVAFKARV
jgi:hypothetical protein